MRLDIRLGCGGVLEKWAVREADVVRRRVPVDWDDLEMALTSHMDEWACYLDLRTGKVHMVHLAPFGDGDEEDDLSEEEIDAGLAAGDLVFIEPLPSSVEYDWMVEFAASVTEPRLRELLEVALDGRGAFRRKGYALRSRNPNI